MMYTCDEYAVFPANMFYTSLIDCSHVIAEHGHELAVLAAETHHPRQT